ncbi:MAG: sodium/proline symporter PutP [Treponema sp.]|jgi:sodium/proline symporter|nr:sodium/proline symporter PutP [Treponema sp.]
MSSANVQMLIGLGVYMAVMISIGLWYSRKGNTNPEDYFLAKRRFGPWLTSMSAQASDMSGWLLMGLPGVAFFLGVGEAFWTALGLFIGTWVNWGLVAKRLRSYSQIANNAITLPEFFSKRFHDNKRILLAIAASISLLFFSFYVGSQLLVVGKLFNSLFGLNMLIMVIVSAIVVLSYTLIGGFLAVGITDLIQALIMVIALVFIFIFGFFYAGGISGITENLQNFPGFLDFFGVANPIMVANADGGMSQQVIGGVAQFSSTGTSFGFIAIISIMAWGLGYFGMPHVLVRFMAVNKISNIRKSRIIAVTWCFIAQFAAVCIGLIGRAIYRGDFGDSESIFIVMSQSFFPPLFAGLIISGILAASMSSSDSYLLIVSSSFANDIYKGIVKKNASEKTVMLIARITMLVVSVLAIFVALNFEKSIFRVVAFAWAGLGASFGPLVLFSLFWKRTTFPAAVAGMISGGVMVLFWRLVVRPNFLDLYELLPAFILSCLVIFLVSLVTKKPSEAIEAEFDKAKAAEL